MISNLQAIGTSSGIELSWSGSGPFRVFAHGFTSPITETWSTSFVDASLTEGQERRYQVCEVIDGQDGPMSDEVSAVVPLRAPTLNTPSLSSGDYPQLQLSGTNNSGLSAPDVSWRWRVDSGSWQESGPSGWSGQISYFLSSPAPGFYEFQAKVSQSMPFAESEWSNVASFTVEQA